MNLNTNRSNQPADWPQLTTSGADILVGAMPALLLGQIGQPESPVRRLGIGFFRLTAKAVEDFTLVGVNNASPRDVGGSIRAIANLEDCLVNLHRALLFLEALRSIGITTWAGGAISIKPKDLPVLNTGSRTRVRAMRDAILHMESEIRSEHYVAGVAIAPEVKQGIVALADVQIRVTELAIWLNRLGAFAIKLADGGIRDPSLTVASRRRLVGFTPEIAPG